ncbi:tRNA (adenosine(37)-N6)-threonylcarbamoyltransferase complex ATPase subunit type 1 TsaE [Candidatus Wolfebacteria bacterium]|nr:tRNA (adenosine(37)-N6)-threonylcarbamoyltransferase complex ATPase subunit type 1 TsaE [Candidatus Wolfebacteria bacterium]
MKLKNLYKTNSSKETEKIAGILVKEILKTRIKNKNALVFALDGDLGAGKTTFVRGFLRGFGIKKKITSPTFIIFKRFKIQNSKFKNVYHMDCYRIKKTKELFSLEIKEIFKNFENIVLIEWPEKIKKTLPKNAIRIKFKHGEKENQRSILI